VDCVDICERAIGVGEADDFFYRIDGPDCVRCIPDRDEFRLRIELCGEVLDI